MTTKTLTKKIKFPPITSENPLFDRFDDVVRAVVRTPHTPLKPAIGSLFEGNKPVRYIDMFCGIGGFHSAADSIGGMECVFACDIDDDCRKAYESAYGVVPQSDICGITPKDVPDHDILFAGFPCQPFSIIGDGEGFDDARGTLFFELAKIIQEKQPKAFVLENVKQLASHDGGKTLARILEVLREELNYTVDYRILNALNFGLPQKRERILIVGFRDEVEEFHWPTKKIAPKPLSQILEKNPPKEHFVSDRIKRARHDAHTATVKPAIWHENKSGNISSHPFSCALRANASHNYLLVDGERRLTSREMLRLQGFPDSFKIVCSEGQTRKQAGNAVPVPMVKAVIQQVLHVQKAENKRKRKAA